MQILRVEPLKLEVFKKYIKFKTIRCLIVREHFNNLEVIS